MAYIGVFISHWYKYPYTHKNGLKRQIHGHTSLIGFQFCFSFPGIDCNGSITLYFDHIRTFDRVLIQVPITKRNPLKWQNKREALRLPGIETMCNCVMLEIALRHVLK